MKQTRKQMIPVIIIIGITFLMSLFLYHQVLEREQRESWQLLEDSAKAVTREFQIAFQNDIATLHLASETIAIKQNTDERQMDSAILDRFCENTLFSRIVVLYPGEEGPDGTSFDQIAEKGAFMSARVTDSETGSQIVVYYIPVKKGKTVSAILAGIIEANTLAAEFKPSIYNGNAVCCVIDSKDGNFVMDQWHDALGNAYTMQERPRLKAYKNVDLKQETKDQATGVIAFRSHTTGQNLYMYYMPLQLFDWELEVFVPEDIVFEKSNYIKELLFFAGIVEALLLCIYFFWNLHTMHQLTESKKETEEQLHISNTLIRCVTALSSDQDIDTAIQKLLQVIMEYFQADRAYIFSYDAARDIFINTYEYAREGIPAQKDTMPVIPASILVRGMEEFEKSQIYYISDIEQEKGYANYDILKNRGIQRLLAVPLNRDGQMIGFVSVDNPGDSYDASLLSSIQFFISNTLAMKKHQDQLNFMSYWDSLTNLYNRNKYIQTVELYQQQTLTHIGVAYLDLNGLKETNDRYGHEAGDALIRETAQILRKIWPENAYRVGGDEFVVLIPDTAQSTFENKIMTLREQMKQHKISCSLGYLWKESGSELEKLLKEADRRMYEEKQQYYLNR